jgi:hypothetical protein
MDKLDSRLGELEARLRAAWVDPRDTETVDRVRQGLPTAMAHFSAAPTPWWRREWRIPTFALGFVAGAAAVLVAVTVAERGHLSTFQFLPGKSTTSVASPTPGAAFLPACLPADIPLSVEGPAATGSVIITVKAANLAETCHLHSKVTVVPHESGGQPLPVRGSPATASVDTDLPSGASGTPIAVFAWANWCGAASSFDVSASIADQLTPTAVALTTGPRCVDRTRPSQLVSLSTPAVTVVPLQLAERTVTGFYDAINARDYANAYSYLGSALQTQQSYQRFVAGFSDTVHDDLVQVFVQTIRADGTVTVYVDFIAHRTQDSSEYAGTYVIGYEAGEPRLLSGQLSELWRKPQT